MLGVFVLAVAPQLQADCGSQSFSGCLMADTLWVDPFPCSTFGSAPWARVDWTWNVGASASFQQRSLVAVAAAPDPFGNEIEVLDDWWTTQAFLSRRLGRWALAVTLPASLGGSGRGKDSLVTRGASGSVAGLGDPRLSLRINQRYETIQISVTQELSLPLGHAQTFLGARSLTYAPRIGVSTSWKDFWASAEVGARLRSATEFGPIRFGSEGFIALTTGAHLADSTLVFVEGWATPSLTRDESRSLASEVITRRVPAEILVGMSQALGATEAHLGVGTSLVLSEETDLATGKHTSFAGPPGPALRLQFQLERAF
jgi:hypothetical protein